MLEVKVLGCNGLYPVNNVNTSGYLVSGDNFNFVLDVGSGVFNTLSSFIKPEKVDAIFISHLHFDHLSDMGVYNYYLEYLSKKGEFDGKIKVFIKKSESVVYQSIASLSYFELCDFEEDSLFNFKGAMLSFFKTAHPVLTYGITISFAKKTLTYSSDGAVSENLKKSIKNSDLTICHAPLLLKNVGVNKAHASAYEVCALAKKYKTKVLLSHYLPNGNQVDLKKEIEEFEGFYQFVKQSESYKV